jgi:hypothetical protein
MTTASTRPKRSMSCSMPGKCRFMTPSWSTAHAPIDRDRVVLDSRYGICPRPHLYDRQVKRTGGAAGIRQDMSQRPIFLVRGEDRAGNDFTVGQDRPFDVGD